MLLEVGSSKGFHGFTPLSHPYAPNIRVIRAIRVRFT